jgi:hypothetical protein
MCRRTSKLFGYPGPISSGSQLYPPAGCELSEQIASRSPRGLTVYATDTLTGRPNSSWYTYHFLFDQEQMCVLVFGMWPEQ